MLRQILKSLQTKYSNYYYNASKKQNPVFDREISPDEVSNIFPSRIDQYKYFHHSFWHRSPEWLREHRSYFMKEERGFGEDAFHAMWYSIFMFYKPKKVLEIGVYRGQVISLWALLAKKIPLTLEVHAISPFTHAGDHVSTYLKTIDYREDVINNFKHFHLELPNLHQGFSTDDAMVAIIKSNEWDLIYIDGNHDYEVVKQDFCNCSNALRRHGLLILDDSARLTSYRATPYSTTGHPGPSKVAQEIDREKFKEIVSVGHNRVFMKMV